MSPELKHKLKKALAGKSAVEMGQFQFINLDEIRQRAGDDWDNIRAKTYEVSGHFIEKRLDPDDVLIRCQGGFLIIFSQLGGVEAEAHVSGISEELNEFFLGERWLDKLRVEAEARRVPTDEFLSIVARTQAEDEPELEADAEPERVEEAAAEAAAAWTDNPVEAGPKGPKGGRWEKATQSGDGHDAEAQPDWPDESFPAQAWDAIVFRPIWDARTSALTHNICLARRAVAGRQVYGRDTLMGQDAGPHLRELDREVALAAQRGFQTMFADGVTCSVVIPVHYETLSAVSHRMSYFSLLQSVPQHMRRYFQIRVDSIPAGAPVGQMQEVFRSMRHFGSTLFAEQAFARHWDLRRFEACDVSVFAAVLPNRIASAEPSDGAVMAMMECVAAAGPHRADIHLDALANGEYVNAGVSAGVRLFSGPAVSADQQHPKPVTSLAAGEMLRKRANGDGEEDIAYI